MVQRAQAVLEPRKTPVQARSVASVDAILEGDPSGFAASRQGTADDDPSGGARRRVGGNAVPVLSNKSALLQAALRRHMVEVGEAVELACKEQRGARLQSMATALITAFLDGQDEECEDERGSLLRSAPMWTERRLCSRWGQGSTMRFCGCWRLPVNRSTMDPQLVASMLQGMMAGVSRRILESSAPEKQFEILRRELIVAACAYLDACSTRDLRQDAVARR